MAAPDIITVTKTSSMGWAEHVAWMTRLKTSTKMHCQLRAKNQAYCQTWPLKGQYSPRHAACPSTSAALGTQPETVDCMQMAQDRSQWGCCELGNELWVL